MKTVLLFPGLDALFQASKFKRWVPIPVVSQTLKEASQCLSKITGQEENLAHLLEKHSRPHVADFDRTLVALTALQIGIVRGLSKSHQWDILLGCSHGDIARSVIAEVIQFHHAIEILWTFAELRKSCPEGFAASVRPVEGFLTLEHIKWLEAEGAPVSLWSDENATTAGDTMLMQRLAQEGRSRGLKIKPVLKYPVHSPAMMPIAEHMVTQKDRWPLGVPNRPVFSSVIVDYLPTPLSIQQEALMGMVSAIRWTEALKAIHTRETVDTFLNVGPCNSLTGWMLGSSHLSGAKILDAWDLIGEPGA